MKLPALKELIEERKETAIQSLSENFARNKLPLEEYERLVEYIHKIESERELVIVEKIVASFGKSGEPKEQDDGEDDVHDNDRDYYPIHERHKNSTLSILSARTFSGSFKSGSQFVNILGSSRIKIRKSDLTKRRTRINVLVILGDCVIMVENGIRINNKVVPILGSSGTSPKLSKQDANNVSPELVISGTVLLGDITVKLLKE